MLVAVYLRVCVPAGHSILQFNADYVLALEHCITLRLNALFF